VRGDGAECGLEQKSKGGSSTRAEQAKLASTLLEASKNAPKIQGKIVNDYGQEEVLVLSSPPRRVACAYPCPCRPPRSPLLTPPRQVTPADRGEGVESLLHGRPRCIRGREHPG